MTSTSVTDSTTRTLAWPQGEVTMRSLGAMLGPVSFRLPSGRQVSPFHTAPWCDEPEAAELEGLMDGLRGEWPCVPFGAADTELKAGDWEDEFSHGYSAHHDWTIEHRSDCLVAGIDYPSDHPIRRLERQVSPSGSGLELVLSVLPRQNTRLPIGLHPVFSLPLAPGQLHIDVGASGLIWCHPTDPQPDPCPLQPGASATSLASMPLAQGGTIDMSRLPLTGCSESRIMVENASGQVHLDNQHDGSRTTLNWQREHLPSLMLWVSNRGRSQAPWHSRHLALGVEPVCAAFDLGTTASRREHPCPGISGPTTVFLQADTWWHTRYSVSVSEL